MTAADEPGGDLGAAYFERVTRPLVLTTEDQGAILRLLDESQRRTRTGAINGQPFSVPEGYTVIGVDELRDLHRFRTIVADLDRNANGRHEGDGDATGVSRGNPLLPTGQRLGWTIDGYPIVVPPRGLRHDPVAWVPPLGAPQ